MPPELPQNNNEVELEAILLETQNQSETLDDIRVTNEAQVLENSKTNEELQELNSTVDLIAEKVLSQKQPRISVEVTGGKETVIEGPQGEKGEKGDMPIKGQDYFTPQEIQDIVNQVQARVKDGQDGRDGQDAVVDYEAIIREVVPLIPKGQDGRDAIVDYDSIIEEVLSQMPKPKDGKDGKSVSVDEVVSKLKKEDVFGEMEKRVSEAHERVNKLSSKTVSLSELDDVDLSGATVTNGKYVIGGSSGGAVDSVNSQTGVVVLDADDIDDTSTTHKFTTAGDISKLAGIETGADVTDTASVTAAGALMDSEVDADIKTLSLPANTTISDFAKTFLDDADAAAVRTTLGVGTGSGDALTSNPLSQFAATTSLQLKDTISDETGSGALVFATSPTLVTPILGTPTSGTLTNCTGLPIAGLVNSTSTALGVGSLNIGHASDTTIGRVSAGVISVEGVTVPTISSTSTFTNKRIQPRSSTAATGDITPALATANIWQRTALSAGITINAPTGTPVLGEVLVFMLLDNGTSRALTWNSAFTTRVMSEALPTATTISKQLLVTCQYNGTTWLCLHSEQI